MLALDLGPSSSHGILVMSTIYIHITPMILLDYNQYLELLLSIGVAACIVTNLQRSPLIKQLCDTQHHGCVQECQNVSVRLLMSTGLQRLDLVQGMSKWK